MRIDEIDQEVNDFDWFAVDINGCIIHFASGGGKLPNSVSASREDLAQLHAYFLSLPTISAPVQINPNLAQVIENLSDISRYTASSVKYAQCSLFSFNKTDLTHPRSNNFYHPVAYPENALSLAELPATIAAIISRTILPFSVRGVFKIDVDTIE